MISISPRLGQPGAGRHHARASGCPCSARRSTAPARATPCCAHRCRVVIRARFARFLCGQTRIHQRPGRRHGDHDVDLFAAMSWAAGSEPADHRARWSPMDAGSSSPATVMAFRILCPRPRDTHAHAPGQRAGHEHRRPLQPDGADRDGAERRGQSEIYVSNAQGRMISRLTRNTA